VEKGSFGEYYQEENINLYDLWLILKKRKGIILLVILGSLCIAIAYNVLAQKVYLISNTLILDQMQEEMLISQGEVIAAVAELDRLLDVQMDKTADLLGLNRAVLKNIKKIKATQVKGSSTIKVDVEVLQPREGILFMEALPGYIQSSPNIKNLLTMQKALMERNRDDLKAIIDNPVSGLKLSSNILIYAPSIDLYSLHEKYNRLDMILAKMEKRQIMSLAWKNEPPEKEYRPKRVANILSGLVLGCILGVFIAFFLEWLSRAKREKGL